MYVFMYQLNNIQFFDYGDILIWSIFMKQNYEKLNIFLYYKNNNCEMLGLIISIKIE